MKVIIRFILSFIIWLCLILLSTPIYAAESEWLDNTYDFSRLHSLGVVEKIVQNRSNAESDAINQLRENMLNRMPNIHGATASDNNDISNKSLQDATLESAKILDCSILTKMQLYQNISKKTGVNLEALSYSNPNKAESILKENCSEYIDGLVTITLYTRNKSFTGIKRNIASAFSAIDELISPSTEVVIEFEVYDTQKNLLIMRHSVQSAIKSDLNKFYIGYCKKFFRSLYKKQRMPNR